LLLEQLFGNAFAQNSEGSFGDDFSHGASDRLGYGIFGCAAMGSCTLQ
jgi:hypothetical protein